MIHQYRVKVLLLVFTYINTINTRFLLTTALTVLNFLNIASTE